MAFAIIAGIDPNCELAMLRSYRFILLLPLFVAGCVSTPEQPAPEAAQSAESAIADGNLVFAAQEYERLAKSNRRQREHYILLAAEAWRDEGAFREVRRVLAQLKRSRLTPAQNIQLDLLLAEDLVKSGEFDQADALLTMPETSIPADERTRYLELKAKAAGGAGRIAEAVATRQTLHALLEPRERADNEAAALALLKTATPDQLVADLRTLGAADARRPWYEESLRDRAQFPPRAVLRAARPVGAWQTDAEGQQHAEGYLSPGRIALLLPLTGEFAMAGKSVRDGFLSAWFASQNHQGEQVRIYDSGSDRAALMLALDAAVKEGATTLVGPIERSQVDALFAALPDGLRVLALNHADMNPVPPAGQFQFGLAPEEEAALAAERLIDQGVQRAGLLLSQEDWAERAGKAFTAQFTALGGSVTGQRGIAPAAVKFTEELDALLGEPKFEAQPVASPGVDTTGNPLPAPRPRMLPVFREGAPQALFVAIRNAQGRMLMPQLRVRGQDGIYVLATSHIATSGSHLTADRDMEGASFLDAPFMFGSSTALGVSRDQFGAEMPAASASPRLFAFGLDAYRLLPYLDYLRQNEGAYLDGASGQLMIDAFGRVRRIASTYRFRNGLPELSQGLIPASGALPEPASPETPQPLPQ